MFENQLALEKRQRYRGPATRFVGPIDSVQEAELVIRECSLALIVFGLLYWFISIRLGYGFFPLFVIAMAAAAGLLRRRPSLRCAALVLTICWAAILLLFYAASFGYPVPIFLPLLWWGIAARAFWAALRRRRLLSVAAASSEIRPAGP